MPQVVATPSAVAGMEPLAHARCTVIKLHGDYASLDQLNTLEELTTYSPEMSGLLDRVLDEYGLVVSGWSADWDHALVAALEGTRSRRYPLYWASYRDLGAAASRLVAQHRAPVITGVAADRFFPDVVSRFEALDSLSSAPLSVAMSIAQLKRALPDPVKHIQVSDLFDEHVAPIRDLLGGRAAFATSMEPQAVEEEHEVLVRSANTLLQLVAHGVYLDRDEQHTSLWVHVIQKLMRARQAPSGAHHQWVDALAHLPALLVLRAAVIAAIEAGHERAVVRMLNEPSWRDPFGSGGHAPAAVVLHDYRVLDHDIINTFPRWNGTRWLYAQSRYIKDTLRPILLPLLGDEETYIRAFNRAEYRTALAQHLPTSRAAHRAAPGEFIGERQWNHEDGLIWEADFRSAADREAWGWEPVERGAADPFDDALTSLTEALKHSRRLG